MITRPNVVLSHLEIVRTGCVAGNPYNKAAWNATFIAENGGGVDGIATIGGFVDGNQSGQVTLRVQHFGQAAGSLLLIGPDCKVNRTVRIQMISVVPT